MVGMLRLMLIDAEIDMQLGGTELWRFVHAGIREDMNLRLVNACDSNFDIPLIQLMRMEMHSVKNV